jgi:threonine aldolase
MIVELRSDTFTTPTPEMRQAMATAEVGDDVWGEDPTVNALQDHCAALLGKEAGLFVSSGTMGNELAIATLTSPGDEIIVDDTCHIMEAEVGGPARIAQVMLRAIPSTRGVFTPEALTAALRPPSRWFSHTTLLCLENTHQSSGGAVIPLDAFREMCKIAHDHDVRVHLDGARLFNAAVASGVHAREYAAEVDTLSFCFSKGLGAPVGSMLLGPRDIIDRARKLRRLLGGAMRQSGVIAAAARVAIDTMVERLHDDHVNARALADGVASFWPSAVDPLGVESNIVYVNTGDRPAAEIAAELEKRDVKVGAMGRSLIRCCTHKDVTADGITQAVAAFREVVAP